MEKSKISIELDVNGIYRRITSNNNLLFATTTLARHLDPYVPFRSGVLSRTVKPTVNGVEYIQPYARRLYYGEKFNFTKAFHPLATAKWLEPMKYNKTKMKEYTQEIERYLKL